MFSSSYATVALSVFLSLWASIQESAALTCYETDAEGHHVVKTDPSWKYCAYSPKIVRGEGLVVDAAFGLGEENDMLTGYDFMFSASGPGYQVIDTCIHEAIDLRGWSPKFSTVEHSFRCVCNYDLCNHDALFGGVFSEGQKLN
ncbi:hypothetical protein AAVH_29258 [Aphelenchoides avenae]|nr:hypothetical protein AAVH_29258 [Aphelenchus avenae]